MTVTKGPGAASGLHSARVRPVLWAVLCCGLTACGGGGGGSGVEPKFTGREVMTEGIEHYVTNHNGYSRVRVNNATRQAEYDAIGQFDDANPDTPAGYRNLIKAAENTYADSVFVEVIAQVDKDAEGREKIVKVLRLTADQAPFDNVDHAGNPIGSGKYHFRGTDSFRVYASVDGGEVRTGVGDLEALTIDFDTGTAAIHLRTGLDATSQIETEIAADNLTFNILTGTFGGAITQTARVDGETLTARGYLRGSISGDETSLSRQTEQMTTSGVLSADGRRLSSDGIFWGSQLNRH
ncbi:viral aspartic protease [Cereibacter sphaeroides]|uniref:viral aspartic protease n=1 Tax=Cereibacter sphaeroides TaxID=1063 RepID=UPI001F3C137B|nr:viral aspartic protease [Cereibacter sphaeroides]MCE6949664.1 viral aspartic protease [Cereibacter sphaeroides]